MGTRQFDAVVFDLNGVLCDSEPFIAAAAAEALRRRYGITVTREDFAPFVGAGDDRFIRGGAEAHGVTADLVIYKPLTYEIYLKPSRRRSSRSPASTRSLPRRGPRACDWPSPRARTARSLTGTSR